MASSFSQLSGHTIPPLNLHPGTIGTICSCWGEPDISLSSTYWIPTQQSLSPWSSKFHNSKSPRAAQSICSLLYWCSKFVQGYHIRDTGVKKDESVLVFISVHALKLCLILSTIYFIENQFNLTIFHESRQPFYNLQSTGHWMKKNQDWFIQ